ncbi:hypothetical protein GCM10023215_31530 [Pseudonocardia yuanmonensis]|uniref:Uncharacterized protein n=1 Tax=Pseudonocardia yuanmonensis TaxID=1095914 RepID=A0ABP8WPP3_9PSEU
MEGYEASQTHIAFLGKETSAVERMESRHREIRGVADVVQPCGWMKNLAVPCPDSACEHSGALRDLLDVSPALRKRLGQAGAR